MPDMSQGLSHGLQRSNAMPRRSLHVPPPNLLLLRLLLHLRHLRHLRRHLRPRRTHLHPHIHLPIPRNIRLSVRLPIPPPSLRRGASPPVQAAAPRRLSVSSPAAAPTRRLLLPRTGSHQGADRVWRSPRRRADHGEGNRWASTPPPPPPSVATDAGSHRRRRRHHHRHRFLLTFRTQLPHAPKRHPELFVCLDLPPVASPRSPRRRSPRRPRPPTGHPS